MVAEGTRDRARFRGLICPTCFHPSLRRVTVARNYANEIVFANGTRSSKGNYSRGGGVERASLSLDEVSLPIREGERELEIGEISQLSIVSLSSNSGS